MNSTTLKKSVTLLTVVTLATFASSAVLADEDFRLSNELGNPDKFEHLNTITSEEPAVEPTNPSEPSTEDQSNSQSGNGTIIVPVDPGTTPPATTNPTPVDPGTTVPPTTVEPTPVDPGITVPPTTNPTPPVDPGTTVPPTTTLPTPEPETKPDGSTDSKPDTSTEPQAEPTPIEKDNFNPFVSDKGQKIIGTEAGSIIIENTDGTTQKVAPEAIGAKTNADGTITVKDADGKMKRLPETGEAVSLLSVLGLGLLGAAGFLSKKKRI